MLILLFEVTPRAERVDEYLATAAELRPALDALGGCLFIDRYRSFARARVFEDYRLRVAAVVRSETAGEPAWDAERRTAWHDTTVTPPRYVAIAEATARALPGALESFESIYRPGEHAHVLAWSPASPPSLANLPGALRLRLAEIERDYGMHDRAEAPQYFSQLPSERPRGA